MPKTEILTMQEIEGHYNYNLSNLLPLMDLILTLPSTRADCEWVFSAIKLIETEHHASLISSALDNLMMVYLNSPAIKIFDLQSCRWLFAKSRIITNG